MALTVFQPSGGGGGGSGSPNIRWIMPDSGGPLSILATSGLEAWNFTNNDTIALRGFFTLPADYTSGTQIFLKKGKMFSATNSGNVLFQTFSVLIKANVDSSASLTSYTSTNAQQAINGTANLITVISDIDLTTAAGQINSVTAAAGDAILFLLQRSVSTETSGVADDVSLIANSFNLVIT